MKNRDREKLKKRLRSIDGYRQTLADRSGLSIRTVDAVLSGTRRNANIIDLAFDLLAEEQKKLDERKSLLK